MALPVLLPLEVRSVVTEPILCPVCRKPMQPTPDASGAWMCTEHGEWLPKDADDAGPPPTTRGQARPLPAGVYHGQVVYFPQNDPHLQARLEGTKHWLSGILGTNMALGYPPQSNITDGSRCLMLGAVAGGGGSKSGRKRKKPPKKNRGPLEPYS